MSSRLTKIEGVPDKATAVPGMAHFAGSHPGELCRSCVSLIPAGRKTRCAKYQQLTGKIGACISELNYACKYWEQRRAQ